MATDLLNRWYRKYFSDPEGIILALLLALGFTVVIFFGEMLAPVLASVVIAYMLDGLVTLLQRQGLSRLPAVLMVFIPFVVLASFLILGLLPLLVGQVTQLIQELPAMISSGQKMLLRLPELYPQLISDAQVIELMATIRSSVTLLGHNVVSLSLASLNGLFILAIYLILVPVLVFFFLKDKATMLAWAMAYLPRERALAGRVWLEMNQQIGNYIRGKMTEIMIVGIAAYLVFVLMGLNYSMLLGALVGLSVVIPYIGAAVVTLPIAIIGYFQWGLEAQFGYLILAYAILQALDGNLLVPWLFSEAVNLHPVAIIIAVLVFGGIWGLWGVFFAIPLATLVKAVLNAWPRSGEAVTEVGETAV
jgi:putative permease